MIIHKIYDKNEKILIIGFELGGLGGTETVCRKFHDLISDKAKVNFLFFKQDKKTVDNVWLDNTIHKTIECHVRNTPLRRFFFHSCFLEKLPEQSLILLSQSMLLVVTLLIQLKK